MARSGIDSLRQKIERNGGAVLSLRAEDDVLHFKSRFLGGDEGGFWLQSPPHPSAPVRSALEAGATVGVSFRDGVDRMICLVRLLGLERRGLPARSSAAPVPALRLSMPDEVRRLQKRGSYRVRTLGEDLTLRVFCHRDGGGGVEVPEATLRDLSLGGAGLVLRRAPAPEQAPVLVDDTLSLHLQWMNLAVSLRGRVLFARQAGEGAFRVGVCFADLGRSKRASQVRQALSRLVTELQRREARRLWRFLTGK